jgi:hypothetical protein
LGNKTYQENHNSAICKDAQDHPNENLLVARVLNEPLSQQTFGGPIQNQFVQVQVDLDSVLVDQVRLQLVIDFFGHHYT